MFLAPDSPSRSQHPGARRWRRLMLAGLALAASTSLVVADESQCDKFDLEVTETPVPSQSANALRRQSNLLSRLNTQADLILLGDSLTQGWPADLLKQTFPGHVVLNLGVGGDKTQNLLWRLQAPEMASLKPKVVILLIGTNNLGTEKTCAIAAGIKSIIAEIDRLWAAPKLLMIEIPPRGADFQGYAARRKGVNELIRQIASERKNAQSLNIDQAITCNWTKPCANYIADTIHFDRAGYETFSKLLSGAIANKE
jgi:lysophospholipase L1-like esterase